MRIVNNRPMVARSSRSDFMATDLAKNTITLTAVMTEYVVKEADAKREKRPRTVREEHG